MRGSSQKDSSAGTPAIVRSPDVAGRVICAVADAMLSKAAEMVGNSSAPCAESLTRWPLRSNSAMPRLSSSALI